MVSLLGKNIKRIRVNKKIKSKDLAEKSGVAVSTISQIENGGRKSLRSDTVMKIACVLDVEPKELYSIDFEEEYEVCDIEEVIEVIFQDEEIILDDVPLNETEIKFLKAKIKGVIDNLRSFR